jgi:Xaa-Pro dipeptidase
MLTRRRFLLTAAATTALSGPRQAAEGATLPPAIAALRSRRAEAHPMQLTERESRLERARSLMHENQIDAIALAGGTSLAYFTGPVGDQRTPFYLSSFHKRATRFTPAPLSKKMARAKIWPRRQLAANRKFSPGRKTTIPDALVAQGLHDAGFATGTLGIEERVPFVFSEGVRQAVRGLALTSATPVTAGCRSIKSPAEFKLMQLANDVRLQVYEAAWKSLQPGMTNNEFSDLIAAGYRQTGFPGDASCQVDAWSALPTVRCSPRSFAKAA